MTGGALPDRLTQLRSRWEADPASRIFLQLAEEYRHLGRLHEALGALDEGLREHPGYLSALVAKGRCLLELGEPAAAREVLERVVRQDATQMVANKLLVRAYLDTGEAARARERLDLYSLLHDGDPEIGDLRSRIDRLDGQPAAPSADAASPPTTMTSEPLASEDDVFDLGAAALATPRREVQDVFDLPLPSQPPTPAAPASSAAAPPAPAAAAPGEAAPAAPPQAAPPPDDDEPEAVAEGEPFPGLVSRSVRRRYHEGLAAEGIFLFAPPAPAPQPAAAPVSAPASSPMPDLSPAPVPFERMPVGPATPAAPAPGDLEPVEPFPFELAASEPAPQPIAPAQPLDLAPEAPFAFEPGPEVAPQPPSPPQPPPPSPPQPPIAEPLPEPATATLGELYLRQGHAGEAERIFREVLRREPENAAARDGLARAVQAPEPIQAQEPEPIALQAPEPTPLDRRARKVQILTDYLDRIRRGSARHVS